MAYKYNLDYGMSDIDDPYNQEDLMNYAGSRAEDLGLDPELVLAMGNAESGFNPNAVSSAGARGVMQLMPGTASDLGVNINDPFANIDGGVNYIDQLSDRYGGSKEKTVAAYNAGPGNVDKYGGVPPFAETQSYVSKVLGKPLSTTPSLDSSSRLSALPSPNRRLADLTAAEEEIKGLQGLKSEALGQLGKGTNLSGQEALITALTAIVPMLIGMGAGGMQGGAMGAQAGAAGAGIGLSGFAAEAKERDAANKLAYSDAATQLAAKRGELKGIRDSIADREEKNTELQFTEAGKNSRTGKLAKAMAKGTDMPITDPDTRKNLQGYRSAAQSGTSLLNTINTEFSSMLGDKWTNEDGSINWDGVKNLGSDQLQVLLGADSKPSQFRSRLQEFVSRYQKELTGTAASDAEAKRIQSIALGGGFLPADIPTIYSNIERMIQNQEDQASGEIQSALDLRGENPKEAFLSNFPKAPKMAAPQSSSQEGMTHTYPSGKTIVFRNGKWEPS